MLSKNKSFRFAGFILMVPALYMNSANTIVPLGASEDLSAGVRSAESGHAQWWKSRRFLTLSGISAAPADTCFLIHQRHGRVVMVPCTVTRRRWQRGA